MNSKIRPKTCELISFFKNVDGENNRDFYIYSFITSDETKFIFVYGKAQGIIEEDDLKKFFKQLHYQFVKIIMNPLYKLNTQIQDKNFEKEVDKLLRDIVK